MIALLLGALFFGVVQYGFEQLASFYGLPLSFHFEGVEYDQYVEKDKSTSLGWLALVIQIYVAARIGMLVYYGNLRGGVTKSGNLKALVSIGCIAIYAIIDTIVWGLFEKYITKYFDPFLYNLLHLIVLIGIIYLGFIFYRSRKVDDD